MTPRKKSSQEFDIKTRSVLDGFLGSGREEKGKNEVLPINSIKPNPEQPRKYFDSEKLNNLVSSIRNTGILQPIIVRPVGKDEYQIVAGERRYRAATIAKLKEIPVVIKDLSDDEVEEIALVENLVRDDLNPIEETQAIIKLIANRINYSVDDTIKLIQKGSHGDRKSALEIQKSEEWNTVILVFQKLGKFTPQGFRTNRLPLLKLPEEILTAIETGDIAYSKGRMIGTIKDKRKRNNLLAQAIKHDFSREEVQDRVTAIKKNNAKERVNNKVLINELDSVYQKTKKRIKSNLNVDKQEKLRDLLSQLNELLDK